MKDAEQWGKKIISIIWHFVADMWEIRNDKEHNNNGKSVEIEKKKEIEQITWLIQGISEFEEKHPYMKTTKQKLEKYPLSKIKAMNEQLQTLYESVKAKNTSRKVKNILIKIEQKIITKKDNTKELTNKQKARREGKIEPNKTNKKLFMTAQAISHVSTHVGGPHFDVG
jgi:hypothetical protein